MKKELRKVGEIAFRLDAFAYEVEAQSFNPDPAQLAELLQRVMAYAGTPEFAAHAVRGQKEDVGTLLLNILDLQKTFK